VLSYGGNDALSYVQVYRDGRIEAVTGRLLATEHEGKMIIPSIAYEDKTIKYLQTCLGILKELDCAFPIAIALTLTNTKGLEMSGDKWGWDASHPISEHTLILPEYLLEDFDAAPSKILKPMFDLVWNACGYAGSKNFDAEGNWVQRR